MDTTKSNPYLLMETEGILKKQLSGKTLETLALYDKTTAVLARQPKSEALKEQANKAAQLAYKMVALDIKNLREAQRNDIEEHHKATSKKAQSKVIVEKSAQVLDDLAMCRQKLKEDRQQKLASGEIAAPKKKTLVTKLRHDLLKITGLIPRNLKEDEGAITRTEKAVLRFLNELKDIWGINKIKAIQDGLNEKFKKLHEQAA